MNNHKMLQIEKYYKQRYHDALRKSRNATDDFYKRVYDADALDYLALLESAKETRKAVEEIFSNSESKTSKAGYENRAL